MSAPEPTHVYIVGYSDNVVKVGRTSNYKQRYAALSAEGRRRGAHVTHQWVKPAGDARQVEFFLRWLGRNTLEKAWGDEYFRCDDPEWFSALCGVRLTWWTSENFDDEAYASKRRQPDPFAAMSLQQKEAS